MGSPAFNSFSFVKAPKVRKVKDENYQYNIYKDAIQTHYLLLEFVDLNLQLQEVMQLKWVLEDRFLQ